MLDLVENCEPTNLESRSTFVILEVEMEGRKAIGKEWKLQEKRTKISFTGEDLKKDKEGQVLIAQSQNGNKERSFGL